VADQQLEKQVQKRAARRVAKTLLFNSVNLDALQAKVAAVSAERQAISAPQNKVSRRLKIAKTLMEVDLDNFAGQSLSSEVNFAPEPLPDLGLGANPAQSSIIDFSTDAENVVQRAAEIEVEAAPEQILVQPVVKKPRQQFVAKTMLDHSILWDTVSKFEAKMEVKVAEQIAERASEPVKLLVPIECKKQAMLCSFKWDDADTKERFRYCSLCKTAVYNFNGLELPEAEELIYQRENKRNATLFKRADGKFMTVNCPVEIKRKRDTVMLSAGGVMLVICAIAYMIFMPHQPKPEPQVEVKNADIVPSLGPGENHGTNTSSRARPVGAVPSDGSFVVRNGQRVYPAGGTAPVTFPAPAQQPAATTDADESGDFWKYDGAPAPVQSPAPVTAPAPSYAPQQLQQQYAQPAVDTAVPKPTSVQGLPR